MTNKNDGGSSFRAAFALLGPHRLEYSANVFASSVLSGVEGILHPLMVKAIFDEAVVRGDFSRFVYFAIGYLTLGLSINIAATAASLWSKALENRAVSTLSRRTLESYYHTDYEAVLRQGQGYFITRIHGDLKEGVVPLLALIRTTISQVVLLVSFTAVLIYLSWQAFLLLAAVIPICAAVGSILGKKIRALTSQEREEEGAVVNILNKALGAFRMVRGFHLVPHTVRVFDDSLSAYLSTSYQRYRVARLFQTVNDSVMTISDFLSMFVGALFVMSGRLTFGGYLAFVSTFWRAMTTLMQLVNRLADFQRFGTVAQRVLSLLSSSVRVYHRTGAAPAVHGLTFSYNGKPVLKNFTLGLNAGEKVVIEGPNGSGKTTLANVLSGHLAPAEGEVVLPERISSVTLPILFPPLRVRDLVRDRELLCAFGLDDDAVLNAYADELSAGQQQKLAISMALAEEAELYVLDEPFANLDRQAREVALSLLLERTRNKSVVVIMHGSEGYHRYFDRVVHMEEEIGAVVLDRV